MSGLQKLFAKVYKRRGLLIIITAAALLELIAAVQYNYSHRVMEQELEKRAESELTMKAILIKSTLNAVEDILSSHQYELRRDLPFPDSITGDLRRAVNGCRYVQGGFMAFSPGYHSDRGRLLELYAQRVNGKQYSGQFTEEERDYTQQAFYQMPLRGNGPTWIDPYRDGAGKMKYVVSYVMPIRDNGGGVAGVAGLDVDLKWLSDTINKRHLYPSSFCLLLTEDGSPLLFPAKEMVGREFSQELIRLINDSTVVRKESRNGHCKTIAFNIEDRKGTIFYAPMKGQPRWQIAVVCYDNEVYGSLKTMRRHLVLLLLLAFGILLYMIVRFVRSEEKLNKKKIEQGQIENELRVASQIQQTLLPADDPTLSGVEDVAVEGRLIPAKAVGGDLYNAFVRDEKLFFCIGDVSGKGVPAALIMATTQTLFRHIAARESNPAHLMSQLNEIACHNNKSNFFTTMFVGVLDLPTGLLRYCNAGHEAPVIARRSDNAATPTAALECGMLEMKPNLPIGLFDDFQYEMQTFQMEQGMTLFLYTDGLTEARNAEHQLLGRERALQMIASCGTVEPRQMVAHVIAATADYSQGAEQSDDLTLLALCYTPVEEESLLDEEIVLRNDVSEVERLNQFIKGIAQSLSVDKRQTLNLRLAVEEAVVNVMEYAYPDGVEGAIKIRTKADGHRLRIVITDNGAPFDPTQATVADTSLSAEERPIGGLGILLVRRLMDSINYERIENQNVLTLVKKYDAEGH
ncbi:MAG: SpoIIE family protein phosphatase [Bacteroidales bacterium]|nr:SpoIIE family protein phosphatase [Bacteroidales bacterium]